MLRLLSIDTPTDPYKPMFAHLVRLYLTELGVDLAFQGLEKEMELLPGKYAPSAGGCMLILVDDQSTNPSPDQSLNHPITFTIEPSTNQPINPSIIPVGCIALRDLGDGVGEIKRMFIDQSYRGRGLSRPLIKAVMDYAKTVNQSTDQQTDQTTDQQTHQSTSRRYQKIYLDTLDRLTAANALYKSIGFKPIPPYCYNPFPDYSCFEYVLDD